jgi:glycerol-3-phosphate dehydrogenase (NAD+)
VNAELGISCSSLSGANIALEVAQGKFSESTLGVPAPENFRGDVYLLEDAFLWKSLFHTQNFRINVVPDVEGVGLCGALKSMSLRMLRHLTKRLEDIVAVAAGFVDGLGWGSNSKGVLSPLRAHRSQY